MTQNYYNYLHEKYDLSQGFKHFFLSLLRILRVIVVLKYLVIILCLGSYSLRAQNYCLQFAKEEKKSLTIEEGKVISFVLVNEELWNKGVITKLTPDSIFVEQEITEKDILSERENNFKIVGYQISAFRVMAYPNTVSVVKGSSIVLLLATVSVAAIAIGGSGAVAAGFSDETENNEKAQKKFFKKNINFNKGWSAQIVKCEDQ